MSRVSRVAISKQIAALKERVVIRAGLNEKIAATILSHYRNVCCLSNAVMSSPQRESRKRRSYSGHSAVDDVITADEQTSHFTVAFSWLRQVAENAALYFGLAPWTRQIYEATSIRSKKIKRENAFWMIKVTLSNLPC